MVNFPAQHELDELKKIKEPFCLTIYLPFIQPNTADNPNRIELKNMLKQAEIALTSAGADEKTIKKTLRSAKKLLADGELWPTHYEALALFMHVKLFRYYYLPKEDIFNNITVDQGFNLAPLLKIMEDNKSYFVLTLSHNQVELYQGDRYRLRPTKLKNFPNNLKEALNIDEYPNWTETHTIAPPSYGKGSEAFHGQYNENQTDKEMLLEFFRRIDRRLHSFLTSNRFPLIIGGVNYLLPLYRQANSYPYLLGASISGNLERTNLKSLHEKAWSLVKNWKMP